jgi:ATP synthase protein I
MPEPDETSREAFSRLDKRLDAFQASRRDKPSPIPGLGDSASQGYRMLGQMLGGVFGGLGLGWLVDRLAHTNPWGIVLGLLAGAGLSIFAVIRTAIQASAKAGPPPPGVASDDDDDD